MSTEVEQRVVQMKFDNAKFEDGVRATMSSLGKLKQSLKFDGVGKGFNDVTMSAKNVDLSPMASATEAISLKFSALQVMAITAMVNITNSALQAGKNLVSAFTLDPIKMGFQEYETQMNAVQTILANTKNKGSTLDDVNAALAELNTYADKTIYNFTEMTRNIGTFTAAGVELDTSVSAIKGIANLAAISGSTSQQASTAMYQLSQALAAGKVSLQDWNSVVNAGMGGEIFQEELKRTSRLMGTGVDEAIGKYGSFRESLTQGAWLTTEVLTATLEKFTGDLTQEALLAQGYTAEQAAEIIELGKLANSAATEVKTFSQLMDTLKEAAQSGWTVTWQTLIGDFEEAKELFTNISDTMGAIIGASADARNNMLIGWKELGGRTDLLNGLKNIWESFYSILSAVGNAFREVFPRTTSEELHGVTKTFYNLTEVLKPTGPVLDAVKMAFKGLFSVAKVVVDVLAIPLKFIPTLVNMFAALGGVVAKVTGFFGSLTSGIFGFASSGDLLNKLFSSIANIATVASGAVLGFVEKFKLPMNFDEMKAAVPAFAVVSDAASSARDKVIEFGTKAIDTFREVDKEAIKIKTVEIIKNGLDMIVNLYDGMKSKVSELLKFGGDVFNTALGKMKQFIEWVDWKQVFEFLTGAVAAKFFLTLASVMKKLSGAFETVAKNTSILADIGDSVSGLVDELGDSLKTWQNSLRAQNLMKIGLAIGVISMSVWALSRIETDKLIPALAAISALFVGLTASSVIIAKFAEGGALKGLMGMGVAILLLSNAVTKLAAIDPVKMALGLAGIVTLITAMGTYSVVMSKMQAQITTGSMVLIAFSTAILILTAAVLKLTNIPATDLAIAMSGIVALALAVSASSKILAKGDDGKGAIKLMAFASSIKTLAKAVKILAGIPYKEMMQGIAGLGMIMLELAAFSRLVDSTKMISTAIGMNILAVAITAMTVPLNILGRMDYDVFVVGLMSMTSMLLGLAAATRMMPKNMISIGVGLNLISSALVVMSGAMAIVGNLKLSSISKALFGFGGALGGLAIALNMMRGTLPASAALLVASTAMIAMAGAVGLMGALPWGVVALGVAGFAGGLTVLSIAMNSMILAAPALLGTAAFMLSFSTSLAIGAAAVGIFGLALVGLATGLAGLGALGVAVIKTVENIALALVNAAPLFAEAAAKLVVAFIEGISNAKNALRRAMVDLVITSLDAIREVVPALAKTIFEVLNKTLATVAKNIEPIITSVVKILVGIIRGISTHLPELVTEAVILVVSLFSSITDALSQINVADLMKAVVGAGLMAGIVAVCSAILPLIPSAAATLALMGGLIMEMIGILALIGGIAQIPGLKWLMNEGGEALELVGKAIGRFTGGLVGGIAQGITSILPTFGTHLGDFMTNAKPFFDGMKNVDTSLATSVLALSGAVAVLTATSFVDGIISFFKGGQSVLVRFGKELAEFAPYYRQYADIMSGTNGDELVKSSNAVKSIGQFVKMIPSQSGLSKLLLGEKDLVGFGKTLADFGPYFAQYARSISGVNPEAITASSNAAKSLAEFAKIVPNKGGLASILLGDNSLIDFGKSLAEFGPHLKKYSMSVTGVNADVVTNSVNAATAIAKFADLVPNKGGLIALFSGDNSLSSLAKDLAKFGPSLASYSDSVSNVSVSSINASVLGATKLISLAEVVPKGKLRLGVLGDELKDFGKSLSKYYDSIKNVNATTLTSSVSAINQLVDMCTNIGEVNVFNLSQFTEGLKQLSNKTIESFTKAFTGSHDKAKSAVNGFLSAAISAVNAESVTMNEAGKSMMKSILSSITSESPAVAQAMSSLFLTLSEIVQNGITNIRISVVSMVDTLTLSITSKSPAVASAMSLMMDQISIAVRGKSADMISAGSLLINSLSSGMTNARGSLLNAINYAVNSAIQQLKGFDMTFRNTGVNLISSFAKGMSSSASNANTSINKMLNTLRSNIESQNSAFKSAGAKLMKGVASGISGESGNVSRVSKNIANAAASDIKGYYWTWYYAGEYLVKGFSNGITDTTWMATARARSMALAAKNAANKALDIHSPSRVGMEIGAFFVKGFANGITDHMSESTDQSTTMAEKAKQALADTLSNITNLIDEDIDYNPVITPVLDLSDVKKASGMLDTMFSSDMAGRASYGMNLRLAGQNGSGAGGNTTTNEYHTTNHFTISGVTDAREVAEEVSRVIQKQVERRDAVWA